ncbi:MAG: hypothetical protein COB78_08370 [Hyphomicrobiales bacterium]|nr:MAG: hypothetical protein COB78_08370 [Hyphomicrobiales bacterium]
MNTQHANIAPAQTHVATQTIKYNKGRPVKILLDATYAFCRFERPGQSDIRQYKEFFYSLIDQTTPVEKREISIALARNYYTPRTVAIFLALGEVSGSTPILLFSPVLKEVDLIAIAAKCTIAGLRVLARRDGLSLRLKNAIKEREDIMATRILQTDEFAVTASVPKAEPKPPISAKVSAKTGVSTTTNPQDELMAMAARGGRLGKQKPTIADEFSTPSESVSDTLIHAARHRDKDSFCMIVGKAASLNPKFISELLTSPNPEALCSLLKALHIQTSSASQILLLLNREIGTSIQLFRAIMAKYDLLDADKCRGELIRMGAHFGSGHQNTPSQSRAAYAADVQDNVSRLERALRTRQQALGQHVQTPSFGNRVRKQYTAA